MCSCAQECEEVWGKEVVSAPCQLTRDEDIDAGGDKSAPGGQCQAAVVRGAQALEELIGGREGGLSGDEHDVECDGRKIGRTRQGVV